MKELIEWFPARWMAYLVLALVTLLVAGIAAAIIRFLVSRFFKKNNEKLNLDPTAFYFVKNAVSFFVYLLALIFLFYNIPELKSVGVALFASAGIFAAIAGFAAQTALANMVSGIMIVVFKPIRVGDQIKIEGHLGIIEDITLRHTIIRNYEHRRVVIPNSIVSSAVILNSHIEDSRVRLHYEIGISYNSDVDTALKVLEETCLDHEFCIDGRTQEQIETGYPKILTRVRAFDESSVRLRAWVWTPGPEQAFDFMCDINTKIKYEFEKAGIEIPFPHRTVYLKKEE